MTLTPSFILVVKLLVIEELMVVGREPG